jgi:hypothetical protein
MISIEEHEALARFARLYGRTWRRELAKRWENGTMLLSQVSVSEDELALLVRLKGKLGPSGLKRYKPPVYVVETRVDGFPWKPASAPNERAPQHNTPGEALLRVEHLLTLDDPMWRQAEYRISETTGLPRTTGPTRCPCGSRVMVARTVDGRGRIVLEPAPENQAHGIFAFFAGAALANPCRRTCRRGPRSTASTPVRGRRKEAACDHQGEATNRGALR